jgi:hypothetical protein
MKARHNNMTETGTKHKAVRVWLQPLLVSVLLLVLLAGCAGGDDQGLDSVQATVNVGSRMLVLRLPPSGSGVQEDIAVEDVTNPADSTRRALRGPMGRGLRQGVVESVRLTPAQWQPVEDIWRNWCFTPPNFGSVTADEPVYEVGLRCTPTRVFLVPANELPPALEELIEIVPSPLAEES